MLTLCEMPVLIIVAVVAHIVAIAVGLIYWKYKRNKKPENDIPLTGVKTDGKDDGGEQKPDDEKTSENGDASDPASKSPRSGKNRIHSLHDE